MSLDVYLIIDKTMPKTAGSGIFIRENGTTREITRREWDEKFPGKEPVTFQSDKEETNEVFSANITHNLGAMAKAAGIYKHLWRPEELVHIAWNGITTAAQLIQPLTDGLALLKSDPDRFKKFNPENGWGNYEGLLEFVEEYLRACKEFPQATINVSR